ncbi:MAG: hypothetical protein KDD42_00820, partial [Bdellovibrionales bacterium]|nr:hypothetical protein [Bdellovibrionales bacterium]
LTGKYAVDLAAKRRASEIHSALQGDLSEDSRKVLSFTAGHVKHTQELTPIEAFRLLSFADKLSSEAKKGLANQDKVHDSSEWREQRKHAESGANAMLQVDKEFKSLRDQLLEGAPSTQVLNLAKRLYHIAWSDRELGKGVVRAEQARDVPLELLLGRRVAEDEEVTAVVVDLKGGGAFGKGFGIGQFAQLFRQIQQVLKEETGAHFIVREGGGKLVLLSEKPPEEINLSALADKVRKIPQQFLQNAENSERAVLALCDYSQRVALYSYLSELRGETKDRVPFAFMEPTISVDQVDLSAGVTLGAFLDKEINGTL